MMCGFAGFFDPTGVGTLDAAASLLSSMSGRLRHRGPDDTGTWVDTTAGIALGHERLSIVDLSPAGHQPMISSSGRYVIAFNGEIYNHRRLRSLLEPDRIPWRGHSDTEVLLESIARRGLERALEDCVGMFAFALWDVQTRTLVLARDRMGEKPLYVGRFGTTVVFASELKALRAHPACDMTVDRESLAKYVRFGYVPAPRSIFVGIDKLPPGTWLPIDVNSDLERLQPVPYWSLADIAERGRRTPFGGSERDAVDELERLLTDAISMQRVADVPLGAFLSGGVDSTMVTTLMQAQSSTPVRTFTIGFREAAYDEATFARQVAEHLGTEHTEHFVESAEALAVVPKLSHMYDEPFADASAIPTYLLARLARRDVTVALSGDGGDELFFGYGRYRRTASAWSTGQRIGTAGRQAVLALTRLAPIGAIQRLLTRASIGSRPHLFTDRMASLATAMAAPSIDDLYGARVSRWTRPASVVLNVPDRPAWPPSLAALAPSLHDDPIARLAFIDAMTYLPDDVLTKVDRATMAVSLESRIPMLDHRIVEFAWTLPTAMKWRPGAAKRVLNGVLHKHVPGHLIDRPKMGFGVPIDEWLRGPLREWAEDALSQDRLAADGFFDPQTVRSLWDAHQRGTADWQHRLWPILVFQEWLRGPTHESRR